MQPGDLPRLTPRPAQRQVSLPPDPLSTQWPALYATCYGLCSYKAVLCLPDDCIRHRIPFCMKCLHRLSCFCPLSRARALLGLGMDHDMEGPMQAPLQRTPSPASPSTHRLCARQLWGSTQMASWAPLAPPQPLQLSPAPTLQAQSPLEPLREPTLLASLAAAEPLPQPLRLQLAPPAQAQMHLAPAARQIPPWAAATLRSL